VTGEERENTLGHQLQGAVFSLRQGQQSFMCQHIGRRSSNVSFECEDRRAICSLSADFRLAAEAERNGGVVVRVIQGLGLMIKLWIGLE
jgi:hypothetical protein